jgi:hypothetical protein
VSWSQTRGTLHKSQPLRIDLLPLACRPLRCYTFTSREKNLSAPPICIEREREDDEEEDAGHEGEGEGRDELHQGEGQGEAGQAAKKVEKASVRSHTERELAQERGKAKAAAAKMELHQDKALHRDQAMKHKIHKHHHAPAAAVPLAPPAGPTTMHSPVNRY